MIKQLLDHEKPVYENELLIYILYAVSMSLKIERHAHQYLPEFMSAKFLKTCNKVPYYHFPHNGQQQYRVGFKFQKFKYIYMFGG